MDWPSTLPPCPILRGVIDRVAAAGADQVERMLGVALNTYKTECDICGAVNEVPNYGDWDCCQCGQGYNYDEAHQIRLTAAQWTLLRNAPRWIPVSERLPEEGVDVLVSSPCPNSDTPNIDIASWGVEGKQGPVWREADCGRIWPTHWMKLPEPPEVK